MAKESNQPEKDREEPESSRSSFFICGAVVVVLAVACYHFASRYFAPISYEVPMNHFVPVPCSQTSYSDEAVRFPRCIPRIRCGRFASDSFVSEEEATRLLDFAKRAMSLTPGGSGGASIFDLSSGALSHNDKFINIWSSPKAAETLQPADFDFFQVIHLKIKEKIAQLFGLLVNNFFLTRPCFFSRLNSKPAKTMNDEYWHNHVDKETYGKFIYTALIYLSSYDVDFHGGRFLFVNEPVNMTVAPKLGRFITFSSGSENPHLVERVTDGTRFALTVAFACDPDAAVDITKWKGNIKKN